MHLWMHLWRLWIRMISLGECSLVLQPKRDNGFRVWLGCSRSRFRLCGLESEYSRFISVLANALGRTAKRRGHDRPKPG
jgi:hypothetical protein